MRIVHARRAGLVLALVTALGGVALALLSTGDDRTTTTQTTRSAAPGAIASATSSALAAREGQATVAPASSAPVTTASSRAVLDVLVVHARTLAPADGVEVHVAHEWSKASWVGTTGQDGRLQLEVAAGPLSLATRARGGLVSALERRLLCLDERADVRLVLAPATSALRGGIVDSDGRPVAEASLSLSPGGAATADALGRFAIEGLVERASSLSVKAPGFVEGHFDVVPEPRGPEHRFVLRRQVRLEGRVLAPAALLSEVLVFVTEDPTPVDAGGRFAIDGLPGGRRLHVGAGVVGPDGERWHAGSWVTVAASGTTQVELALARHGAIQGRAHRARGSTAGLPLRLVQPGCSDERGRLGPDGGFRFEGVEAGPFRLLVGSELAPVGVAEGVVVAGETTTVDLLADGPACDVAVLVVDPAGAPAPRAFVALRRGEAVLGGGTTDRAGRLVVQALPPGPYLAYTSSHRDDDLASRPVALELESDAPGPELRLVLEPQGEIVGRVVDEAGDPVAAAEVEWSTPACSSSAQSDVDGVFRVSFSLTPGPCALRLRGDEPLERVARRRGVAATRSDPVTAEVRAGETTEVVVRIVDEAGGR